MSTLPTEDPTIPSAKQQRTAASIRTTSFSYKKTYSCEGVCPKEGVRVADVLLQSMAELFLQPDYLQHGNPRQQRAYTDLRDLKIMEVLRAYGPVLAGTVPIGIDVPGSDLDIICHVTNFDEFARIVQAHYEARPGFLLHQRVMRKEPYILAQFQGSHFEIEIFGQDRSVVQQNAYRHMLVEYRLLQTYGNDFRNRIVALKQSGIKTEPAFAQELGLEGDPYEALLELELELEPDAPK